MGVPGTPAPQGAIAGQLRNLCAPNFNFTGAVVHIAGRGFTALTGADGAFQLDNIPAGTYDVLAERNGLVVSVASQVVVSDALVDVGELTMPDLMTDAANCGACGNACGSGNQCVNGVCQGSTPQCVVPADCPGADDACRVKTCVAGVCGFNFSPAGTVVGNQVPGDCRANVCDGNGNTIGAADNSDLPADDGNQCTADVCVNGTPVHPPAASGTACNQGGGSVCNATGSCVQCATADQCPAGNACQVATCTAGVCGFQFAAAGTICSAGSCTNGVATNPAVCDGTGTCQQPTHTLCSPYACNGATACRTSCTDSSQCALGNICSNNQCVPALAQGSACTANNQCVGGNCVDGFCCNSACTGSCQACSAAKKGNGANGVCGPIAVNADPDNECANGTCNGAGACFNFQTDPNNCGNIGTVCASGVCAAGVCVYSPSGVQNNLPIASLTGWTQCYIDRYNVDLPLAQVLSQCNQANLALGCRATGANTLDVWAWGPRADVLFDTGATAQSVTTHVANGVGWYYSPVWSWGFAGAADTITRFVCDSSNTNPQNRLCWHTGQNSGGFRCGGAEGLNNSAAFERIVYQHP